MLNLFRGRGQQHPQAKDTQQATRLLPETPLIDEGMPSGIPPEGKVTVTLSSQFGSGGAEIGRIVAQECGLLYLDLNVEQAARQDEQTVGTVRHVLDALSSNSPFAVNLNTLLNPTKLPAQSQELIHWQLTRRVILELATAGDAVIIGRGSQFLLHRAARTLHIYVFAPLADRIENVMKHVQVDRARAARMVEKRDYEREAYLRRYYGSNQDRPELYHLLINTGLFPFDLAADLIKQTLPLAKAFGG